MRCSVETQPDPPQPPAAPPRGGASPWRPPGPGQGSHPTSPPKRATWQPPSPSVRAANERSVQGAVDARDAPRLQPSPERAPAVPRSAAEWQRESARLRTANQALLKSTGAAAAAAAAATTAAAEARAQTGGGSLEA